MQPILDQLYPTSPASHYSQPITMDGLLPLLITSVVIGSCFSAPVTTPSLTPTPVDQDGEAHLNFLDIEDVMMDPTAKMRKLARRRVVAC